MHANARNMRAKTPCKEVLRRCNASAPGASSTMLPVSPSGSDIWSGAKSTDATWTAARPRAPAVVPARVWSSSLISVSRFCFDAPSISACAVAASRRHARREQYSPCGPRRSDVVVARQHGLAQHQTGPVCHIQPWDHGKNPCNVGMTTLTVLKPASAARLSALMPCSHISFSLRLK